MCGLGGNGGVWMDGWLDGWYGLIRGICMEQQTNNFTPDTIGWWGIVDDATDFWCFMIEETGRQVRAALVFVVFRCYWLHEVGWRI